MPRYTIHTISRNPATWIRLGVRAYLHDCKRRAMDMRPAWPYVLAVLRRNMEEVFDNEGAVDGEPRWASNSTNPIRFHGKMDTTAARAIAQGFGARGHLRAKLMGRLVGTQHSYRSWKRLAYPGRKIMELTGFLKDQLTTGDGAHVYTTRGKLVYGSQYQGFTIRTQHAPDALHTERPRSPRDNFSRGMDLGGVLDAGRTDYYPMEPRELFRITEASLDEISEHIADYVYGV